jgi:hypothetical protein
MPTANVSNFLKQAHADDRLAEQTRGIDAYEVLAELSSESGHPAEAADFRSAFMARNARVLLEHMIQRGLVELTTLDPAEPIDAEVWNRVAALDLTPVAQQLTDYQGWTPARAASVERRYRRFLYLKTMLPEGNASPTHEVDEFWHQHIINTRRYGPDCEAVAGRFLHHTFLAPEDPAEAGTLNTVWLITQATYESLFEEPYEGTIGEALLRRWPRR